MHEFYNMDYAFDEITLDREKAKKLLEFRINFLQEELNELKNAENADDVVDALIDLCVVAIGTLDAFGVDSYQAWDNVLEANMNKKPGIKEGRPNPLGLPDLMKPEGWTAPSHKDNIGTLEIIFKKPVCDL
jgi:predicted HAD superfamily Cof-like phosphohydrolase